MRTLQSMRPRESGATLIEVLIAALILAVGMLGIGAMQAVALKNSQSSLERSQAVIETYSILDMMRANPVAARSGAYNIPLTCAPIDGAATRAELERNAWLQGLQLKLGEESCGRIACVDDNCEIEVAWDDGRATGGDSEQRIRTVARL